MATKHYVPFYAIRLESPFTLVKVLERYGNNKALCAYFRHGSYMCGFIADSAQIKKIDAGKGRLRVTEKMISDAKGWQ